MPKDPHLPHRLPHRREQAALPGSRPFGASVPLAPRADIETAVQRDSAPPAHDFGALDVFDHRFEPPVGPALQSRLATAPVQRTAVDVVQRWIEYTTKFAEQLADDGYITIFDDRLDHIVDRHGLTEGDTSGGWYKFNTDDKDTIKGWIETALEKGKAYLGVDGAFDFQRVLGQDIGVDSDEGTTKRIRVVVVQRGRIGDRGKVQTAYPIAE